MVGIPLIIAILAAGGVIRRITKDPAIHGLSLAVGAVLTIGTFFYWSVEGWSILDSLYFSVIALLTVGFGDFTPETALGKVFTIIYVLMGVGLLMGFATAIVQRSRLWARLEEGTPETGVEDGSTKADASGP